tara:strand:+ start:415 stop:867 length:453 start_codon:yes stop_codon:yes gene_type:complete
MESGMLKMLKSQNPDKEYPSKTGKKWNDEEETLLLEELSKNIGIQLIAQSHNRTIGGINARRREIAYNLYINNTTMEEIILKTKLEEDKIMQTIKRRQNHHNKCKTMTKIKHQFSIEMEINEMKNDIKELKNTVKELVEIMKAAYEFEDA